MHRDLVHHTARDGPVGAAFGDVMARGHCQVDAGNLALSGPQEAVLATKVAISELLILMGRAVPSMGWFFWPCPGLSLFLGEGDGTGLWASAVERLGGKSGPDSGASVVTRRVLSRRGAPHTCLEVCSPPGAMGLAAGAVLLTLEAVARAQVASVAICMDLEGVCLVEAVAEAIDTFARGCPAAPLSSVFMVAADRALVATFHGACAKRWPPGESRQELLGHVLRAQEKVSTQVVSGSLASQKVMHQMVQCCFCSMYGTFLESMSFPLLGASQTLLAMLEEISCFLEHQPNIWMKLVQIVHPLGLPAPRLVAEDPSTRAEALGFCWPEHPPFLRYVDKSAAVRREFKGCLEEAGYGFRACPQWEILTFPAVASPAELHGWEAVFCSVSQHYVVHREGWEDLLEALATEPSLVKAFGSSGSMTGRTLAFQRQLVSQEYLAEPLPRWVIIKDMVEKEQLVVVGFQPYVAQAEAAVREYLQSNSLAEEQLDVPRPELAETGVQLLRLMDWEHLQVTVQLHPNPQVLSLGLRGLLHHLQQGHQG
ncbi:unnamed protein product [Lepidochelys kempii]